MSPFVILRRSVQLLVALILFAPSAVRAQQTFTTFQAAGVVAGQANFTNQVTTASQTVTPGPTSVAISATGKMAVGEQSGRRALIWNSIPATNGAAADVVVGQVNFTTTTGGVTASLTSFVEGVTFSPDGSKLIVCDAGNNRVLIWNSMPTTNGQPADVVIGQTNFTTNTAGVAADKLSYPAGVLVTPDGKLVVTELSNNRVLIFNSIPTSNGASADVVIGQASMTTNSSGSGANQMARPWHCAYSSDGKLLVAEESNNRVLVFNTLPTTNGASANVVVGQTAFGVSTGGTTSSKLSIPIGVAVSAAGQLSIGEFSNNRVLIYNSIPTSNGAAANVVLGQPNFTSNTSFNGGMGAQSMSRIYQLAYAADGRLLASGRDMRRVMIFAGTPSGGPPVVTTSAAGSVTATGAMLNGTVNPNGLATTGFFRYGTDPTLTVGTNTAGQALGSGNSAVAVAQAVSGLLPLTTYYFRASATNSAGTTNGGILSFTTLATPPTVVTLPATGLVPTGALLNGTVNPNGGSTDVRFQYSTDPGLAGATLTPLQNIGAGIAAVPVSAALTGLVPKTTYYFRAVGTNSGGTVNGAILSFTTNVVNWGGGGSDPTTGILDPTLIPTSGTRTFTNVNGQGYDIVVTTSNLNAGGGASYFGDSGWWFEGGGPSYGYGTVTFRFYDTVTGDPYPLSGIDFRLLDAETDERFRSFGYWDASNSFVSVPYGTGRLTFSHTPIYHATDGSYDNGAPKQGGDQVGKWVELNLADLAITGFTFQAHRQTSSTGSVIMSDLISPFAVWRAANFGPIPYPPAADDFANPDNDGPVNVIEYFYGTNPNIADTPNPQVLSVIANRLAITFPRSVAATDTSATVEGADNAAGPWTGLARSVNGGPFAILVPNAVVAETGTGLIRTVEVRDEYLTTDPLHPMRFLRLQVVH